MVQFDQKYNQDLQTMLPLRAVSRNKCKKIVKKITIIWGGRAFLEKIIKCL